MFVLTDKLEMGARFHSALIHLAADHDRGVDGMKVLLHMAGVLVETYLTFQDADHAMQASFKKLALLLQATPEAGALAPYALPPAHIVDFETERGRLAARVFFEEWDDCQFELHDLLLTVFHHVIIGWEDMGVPRAESLRLLIDLTKKAMAFEIAAQELCDICIDGQIDRHGWSIADCIVGLSAVAGRRLAVSANTVEDDFLFRGADLPDELERVTYTMTQEAVRLGVPAGSDWRFGLPANDTPVNAPVSFFRNLEPDCIRFFTAIRVSGAYEQAICCAKAAGRMIAIASGGELPEIEPSIAKPLAMSALTETYKYVCMDFGQVLSRT